MIIYHSEAELKVWGYSRKYLMYMEGMMPREDAVPEVDKEEYLQKVKGGDFKQKQEIKKCYDGKVFRIVKN